MKPGPRRFAGAWFGLRQAAILIAMFAVLAAGALIWFISAQEYAAEKREQSSALLGYPLVSLLRQAGTVSQVELNELLDKANQASHGLLSISEYSSGTANTFQDWHRRRLRPVLANPDPGLDDLILTVLVKDTVFEWRTGSINETAVQYFQRFLERLAELRSNAVFIVHLPSERNLFVSSPALWTTAFTPVEVGLLAIFGGLLLVVLLSSASRHLSDQFKSIASFASTLSSQESEANLREKGVSEAREIASALNGLKRNLDQQVVNRTQALVAVSHDLRTPATRMKLRAELIEDEVLRAKLLKDLDEMTGMINSTIAYLRHGLDKEAQETVMFLTMMESICDDYADVGRNVTLHRPPPITLSTPGTLFDPRSNSIDVGLHQQIILTCRPNALRRAFSNIIDNALHYGDWARVTLSSDAEHVTIAVLDGGPGLAKEEQARVFLPFYRVDGSRSRSTGGTGLGLSVANSIVEIHGGEITLANHAVHGLEVKIRLPRVTRRQAEVG